jgi:anti-anti-sigma regulatory factor
LYAPQLHPLPAPVILRLIGVLDAELVAAFSSAERGLAASSGATVLVDVRDADVIGEGAMHELAAAVASARSEGRDVRLDTRSVHWRRAAKQNISLQPPIDAELRSAARRTLIVAHSPGTKRKRR